MPIYRITAPLIEYCKKLQNVKNHFGVVEAAGSNPVTQTNANSVVMRKASYLSGWLAFCYLHNIYMSV